MKRNFPLYIFIAIIFSALVYNVTQTEPAIGKYNTQLSPDNEITIVRTPPPTDYTRMKRYQYSEFPTYDPDSDQMWQVDVRSSNLTKFNLKERIDDLMHADFDSVTKWPDELPEGFNPRKIMELGKNPGLGVRKLHQQGITGKGVGIAIIDQGLLADHAEYKDRLKLYEEIHCADQDSSMHGPAVASIAVGKTVGAAPEADLYYIAETHGVFQRQSPFVWDLSWLAKSIDRIVEINRMLPQENKIRVISISLGVGGRMNNYEQALASIEKAKQEGIYTVYVGSNPFMGMGRDPLNDADDFSSFTQGEFWKERENNNERLLIPMDSRCTASPTGTSDYVFYREGGMSWSVPYVAGLYALACQVKPDITPDEFWEEALKTAVTIEMGNKKLGKIVNPPALIRALKEM